MESVRLSVVIPCYNHGKYLMDALDCFPDYVKQKKYEIIIVDDGSTDPETLSVLERLKHENYRIIRQPNQGLSSARNAGIVQARGEYIYPLDSDDKVSVGFFDEAIAILDNHPEFTVVYSDGEYFGTRQGPWVVGEFNLQRLMIWNYLHSGAVFRKEAWQRIGGYDTNLNHMGFEDWDLWLSIAFSGGKFHYLHHTGYSYRITPDSMVRRFSKEKYRQMHDYIKTKHSTYLSDEHINVHLVTVMKRSKKLWLKLLLRVYFPKLLSFLVKKKIFDSEKIFT